MRTSFIGRAIHGEDLLAPVTAAVINEVPELGRALAELFTGAAVDEELAASAQQAIGDRERLALVLRGRGELEVWVEADEPDDQLATYDRLLRRPDASEEQILVLVSHDGSPATDVPAIRTCRWRELATLLERWASDRPDLDDRQR